MQYSENWKWRRYDGAVNFWIGTDLEGRDWLLKMRGGFCAFRERAFSVIAQSVGISCQSSTFLKLSPLCDPLRQTPYSETSQSASLYVEEHAPGFCGPNCSLRSLADALVNAGVKVHHWPA